VRHATAVRPAELLLHRLRIASRQSTSLECVGRRESRRAGTTCYRSSSCDCRPWRSGLPGYVCRDDLKSAHCDECHLIGIAGDATLKALVRYRQGCCRRSALSLAAEKPKDQLSRDFLGCSIFDFCNNIGQKQTSGCPLDLTSATSCIRSGTPLTMRRPDEPAQ
jgi:hypothetical protein